ncbi:MAG TPA: hypothetical protein VE338_01510 [Ktedonobacterales bacterium]|nr:hypothetical protein [Ktedonobacterales bacterium]
MASRFTSTTRLSNVIQMVTLSKQSGILRAMRGQGAQREMGQIRFISGEPVSALLGSLTGGTALSALSNWGECVYQFDEVATDATPAYPSLPKQAPTPSYTPPSSSTPPGSAGSWPSYGYPSTNSLGPLSPFPDFGASGDVSAPGYADVDQSGHPGYGYQGAPDPYTGAYGSSGYAMTATATPPPPLRPEQLMSRPRRTSLSEQIEQLPLDRRERMVLLLVDGQRSVADLVKLTRRSDTELYSVLNHLRILGLVLL